MTPTCLKLMIAMVGICTVGLTGAIAQKHGEHHMTNVHAAKADLDKLTRFLGATPEQTKRITVICDDYRRDLATITAGGQTAEQPGIKIKTLRARAEDELSNILTSDQMKLVRHAGGLGLLLGDQVDGPWAFIEKLNLTTVQLTKIKPIILDAEHAMDIAKQTYANSPDEAKHTMQQVHHESMQKIAAVLTTEQLKLLHEMMAEHGFGGH